jgi:methionyl-tRNA synthetase
VGQSGDLREQFEKAKTQVGEAMEQFAFHRALAAIWDFVAAVNRYVDSTQPWALAKNPTNAVQLQGVLYELGQALWGLGMILDPFLPTAAGKVRAALGHTGEPSLAAATWGGLAPGTSIQKLSGLFPRIEDRKPHPSAASKKDGPVGDTIGIADFGKVELRVAEVLAAEAVPKSKKLLKLTVSLGGEQRTIVAGIAQHYAPADLVGKKVVVVANLEPATLMGVQSQGMVLAGSTDNDGALAVLTLDRDLPPGARVR